MESWCGIDGTVVRRTVFRGFEKEVPMYRFFVPDGQIHQGCAEIAGDDVNHIKNVLRMEKGDPLVISCGQGTDYYCIIKNIRSDQIDLEVEREMPVRTELPLPITLFQALPKADKMEWIIQKAVELGAVEIVPVRTRRCVVRLDESRAAKKRQRWQSIAEAAAKQSGRGIIPAVHEVVSFTDALRYAAQLDNCIIPYELFDDMAETQKTIGNICAGTSIGIFIGPEGGFERGEIEQAMREGVAPISLGRRILRTETAGLAILSVLMFRIEGGNDGSLFG